jgi:hypothetical protein
MTKDEICMVLRMAHDALSISSIQPNRKWVGLTDEDMKDHRTHNFDFIHGARWAEAKLKEKNT